MKFKFPDVGEGIHEGVIVKWHVKPGDSVNEDAVLCEVETDKAVVEIPSPRAGKVEEIFHGEGETVHVGEVLVRFADPDDNSKAAIRKNISTDRGDQGGVVGAIEDADKNNKTYGGPLFDLLKKGETANISSLPALHSLISGKNANASSLSVEKEIFKPLTNEFGDLQYEALSSTRKAIISHLAMAKNHTVAVTQTHYLDVTDLGEYRSELNLRPENEGAKLSYLPFIILALREAVKKYPRFNASWNNEIGDLVLKKYLNLGLAVDTKEGLLVPVIKKIDQMTVIELAKQIAVFTQLARERKLKPEDFHGQSITVSNYGSLGSVLATPIINFPDTCILGIGAIQKSPALVNGNLVERLILPLSLTFDHRFNDGADAARFLNEIGDFLKNVRENVIVFSDENV